MDKHQALLLARLAQSSGRIDDMCQWARHHCELSASEGTLVSDEAMSLLSTAYKAAIEGTRNAIRVVLYINDRNAEPDFASCRVRFSHFGRNPN